MSLPANGFVVRGNTLRMVATMVVVAGVVFSVASDRVTVGNRLEAMEYTTLRLMHNDSLSQAERAKLLRRQCMMLIESAATSHNRLLVAEADSCKNEMSR